MTRRRRAWGAALVVMAALVSLLAAGCCQGTETADELSPLEKLLAEIVPVDGPARPPYQPARYDLGLDPRQTNGGRAVLPTDEDPFGGGGRGPVPAGNDPFADPFAEPVSSARADGRPSFLSPAEMRARATVRQERLERLWQQVKSSGRPQSAAEVADHKLAAYAFGEAPLAEAVAAARRAGTLERFHLARVLLAECRFNEAVEQLAELVDTGKSDDEANGQIADCALALLVRHQIERVNLAEVVPVLPLRFDLDGYLARSLEDPARGPLIRGLRNTIPGGAAAAETLEYLAEAEEEVDIFVEEDETFEDIAYRVGGMSRSEIDSLLADTGRLYLVTSGNELALYRDAQEWLDGDRVELKLFSIFGGPVRLKLYRFTREADLDELTAEKLAAASPARTWAQTFVPLAKNNRSVPREQVVAIDDVSEGYYLLTAEARYAPMIATCTFHVSHVAVYLRAGCTGGVAVAVDRRNGRPVAHLQLRLHVTGRPDAKIVAGLLEPKLESVFLAGFQGKEPKLNTSTIEDPFGDARLDEEALAELFPDAPLQPVDGQRKAGLWRTHRHVALARAYAQGVQARQRYPDFDQVRVLETGSDGSVRFPLDLARPEYRYELLVERTGTELDPSGLTRCRLEYQHPQAAPDRTKAVVWLAQPIHRPGSTVHFKGIVRRFNGLRVAPHDGAPKSVEVRVTNRDGVLWEGPCELSDAGTFHGSFKIPQAVALGPCRFSVDGAEASPWTPLKIAEFRLPTYRVDLSVPSRTHAGGESLQGEVTVKYFTGKPAAGAEVELVVETGEENPPTAVGLTDEQGRGNLAVALPQVETDRSFSVRATVMDASGQAYSKTGSVYVSASAFRVEVAPSRSEAVHGESIEVQVRALAFSGKPVVGATATLGTSIFDGLDRAVQTDKQGLASFRFPVAKEGNRQQFVATVIAGGNVVRSGPVSIRLKSKPKPADPSQPTSTDPDPAEPPPEPGVSIYPFPERIDAGEPLNFSLQVRGPPERKNLVALFVENDRIWHVQILHLPPGEHPVSIPTRRAWAPALKLTAVLLDGRKLRTRSDTCYVHLPEYFLTLQVATDKAAYRPGERCTAVVTATDCQGRPAPRVEISLGVVDEAIYSLMRDPTPDVARFFHEFHLPHLCHEQFDAPAPASESSWYWLGPRYAWGYLPPTLLSNDAIRSGLLGRYGGSAASGSPQIPIRDDFKTTAHWVADLVTDDEGRARTTFSLPDNITSWRFTARGVTADTRIGEVRRERRTLLPLQVELALPRGFRAGDRIDLPVVLHNNSGLTRQVHGTTRIADGRPQPWPERELGPSDTASFAIPVTADAAGETAIFASILADADGDAIEKKLVALPRGHRFTRAYSGSLGKKVVLDPRLGAELTDYGLRLTIRREPGLAGPINSALDGLIQYPYGCVEQTMSRFMPAVVAGHAIQDAGLENPAADRLPAVFDKALARLIEYQHRDGGWGWWKDDKTNDFMTAYVLQGLALCRGLDHAVPERVVGQAQRYLAERLRTRQLSGRRPGSIGDVHLAIYAAHALATLYQQQPEQYEQGIAEVAAALEALEASETPLSLLERLLLADTWRLAGQPRRAEAMLVLLQDKVALEDRSRGTVFVAAALLELATALQPDDVRWSRLARQLVELRRGTDWGDTLTTSAAVRGLAAVLATVRNQEKVPVSVRIDGRKAGVLGTDEGDELRLSLPSVGQIELEPARDGSHDYYSIRLEGFLAHPPANPVDPVVKLGVQAFRLRPTRTELRSDVAGRLQVPRGVTVELITHVELTEPVSHARLTIPRPCGFELVSPPKFVGGIVAVEERDDALHYFIDHWKEGVHELRFLARAELSGTVSTPQPELVPMYADTLPTAVFAPVEWVVE